MLYVSRALRAIVQAALIARQLLQELECLIERDPLARSGVEVFARSFAGRRVTRQQVGVNHIVDKREVAALLAVAMRGRLFAPQHLRDEYGQHAGIHRRWILERAEDIEV